AAEKAHGALPHLVIDRHPSGHAYLDDYAALILGLLDLEAALQAESEGLGSAARRLAGEMVELFYDQDRGGFYSTSVWHGELFGRVKPVFDQPLPSGNALAIECLLALGDEELARRSLASLLGWIERAPQATESLLASGLGLLAHSRLIDETAEAPTTPLASSAVQVRLASGELRVGDDGWARGSIEIDVPEAMHLNGNRPPARWLTPTSVEISPMVGEVDYPPGDEYSGRVEIPFRVRLDDGVVGAEFEVTITYQACTQSECLAPQEVTLNGVVLR
ncbi:MAG: hypothetical protein HY248_05795, partial [Fimbriimonas ginsengisoli]|nr:hypothetical protein [Fimbriimonas ginsengisoli]